MSLAHVLLTSLIEKPSTGIELARRFDRSMGFFWNATHQQIYRELSAMQNKGWISTIEDDGATSRKKTYQAEQLGRTELADWLVKQSPPAQLREELMVRLRVLRLSLVAIQFCLNLNDISSYTKKNCKIYQSIFAKDFGHAEENDRTLYIHRMILQLGFNLQM